MAVMKKILALVMTGLLLLSAAAAEETQPFDVDLLWQANSAAPLPAEYEPQDLVKMVSRRKGADAEGAVYTTSATSIKLRQEAAGALVRLCAAAEAEGLTLYVRQGYRSYEDEAIRYARLDARGEAMQMPGECDYQTGLAATVVGAQWRTGALDFAYADTDEGIWLAEHAPEHGFVLRYPEHKMEITGWDAEPWHIRYVGMAAAAYMQEQDLCLEEMWTDVLQDMQTTPVVTLPEPVAEEKTPPAPVVYVPGQVVPLAETGPDGDYEISFIYE